MHPRAVVAEERLWHERHGQPVPTGDVLGDVLVAEQAVGHAGEGRVLHVDLRLPGVPHLVVLHLDLDAPLLHLERHLAAHIQLRVRRGDGEVTFLHPNPVPQPGLTGVPRRLRRVDAVARPVRQHLVLHVAEDVELGLRPKVARVGDPRRLEIFLGLLGHIPRISCVGFGGDRVVHIADHGEGGDLGEGVRPRRSMSLSSIA